jgi:hypothetical protein
MAFRDLGPKRTISGAAQALKDEALRDPTKKSSGRGNNWSRVHNWVARARAWDNHMQSARDDVKRSYAATKPLDQCDEVELAAIEEANLAGKALQADGKRGADREDR